MPNSKFNYHLEHYRSQHKTTGCKITHLVGIPAILISVPLFFIDWRKSIALFSFGWLLQFIGHYIFEKNSPVLLSKRRHPVTFITAVVYAGQFYRDAFKSLTNSNIRKPDESDGFPPEGVCHPKKNESP